MQVGGTAWNEVTGAGLLNLRAAIGDAVSHSGTVLIGFVEGELHHGTIFISGAAIALAAPAGGPVGPSPVADRWRFQGNGRLSIVVKPSFSDLTEITVEHAAAPTTDGRPGKAPITLKLNQTVVIKDYDPARHGGASGFVRQEFLVPKSALYIGMGVDNQLTIEKQGGADMTNYWIPMLRIAPKGL